MWRRRAERERFGGGAETRAPSQLRLLCVQLQDVCVREGVGSPAVLEALVAAHTHVDHAWRGAQEDIAGLAAEVGKCLGALKAENEAHIVESAALLLALVHKSEVNLSGASLDAVVQGLSAAIGSRQPSGHATEAPAAIATPIHAAVEPAARALGHVVFANPDRCTKYVPSVLTLLADVLHVYVAPGVRPRRPRDCGALHALLICAGNVVTRCATKAKDMHAPVADAAARHLLWLVPAAIAAQRHVPTGAATSSTEPEDADALVRLLSSCLRVLHAVLATPDASTVEALGRDADSLLRGLRLLMTYGRESARPPSMHASAAATPTKDVPSGAESARSGRERRTPSRVMRPRAAPQHGAASWYTDSDSGSEDDRDAARDEDEANAPWPRSWSAAAATERSTLLVASDAAAAGPAASVGSRRPHRILIRVRATAINCIAACARHMPKRVHAQWAVFIPEIQGTHPNPVSASILTVLLYDPSARVREAAAAAVAAIVQAAPLARWISPPVLGPSPATDTTRVRRHAAAAPSTSSLSDKTLASLRELEVALLRALEYGLTRGRASFVAATLKACGNLFAVLPLDRTLSPELRMLFDCVAKALMTADAARIAIAALQALGSLMQTEIGSPQQQRATTDEKTVAVGSLSDGAVEAVIQFAASGQSVPASLRADWLSTLSKATRGAAAVCVARRWSVIAPLILDAVTDPAPQIRAAALRLLEEVLHARAIALDIQPSTTSADADDADAPSASGDASADRAAVWSTAAGTDVAAAHRIGTLIRGILPRAVRDAAAPVRAAALMCMSYLCPDDWVELLRTAAPHVDVCSFNRAQSSSSGSLSALDVHMEAAAALRLRNEMLRCVFDASTDPVASVRVAVVRTLGMYCQQAPWRTPAFTQLAVRCLVHLLGDDSVEVRSKASWALGCVCAPMDSSPARALAASLYGRRHARGPSTAMNGGTDSPAATGVHVSMRTDGTVTSNADTPPASMYPTLYENAEERAEWLPASPAWTRFESAAAAARTLCEDTTDAPTPPMEMYCPGVSQSALVNLLGLETTRIATVAALRASEDVDKVASTAVRTLGYCVQALLLHWLPLPVEMKSVLNPVVRVHIVPPGSRVRGIPLGGALGLSGAPADAASPAPAYRPAPQPCPDDPLLRKCMLLFGSIVHSAPPEVATRPTPLPGPPAGEATTGARPSEAWENVGEDEDVREVIARRVEARGMQRIRDKLPKSFSAEDDETTLEDDRQTGRTNGPASPARARTHAAAAPLGGMRSDGARPVPAISSAHNVKVQWNACHALRVVLPLTHRVVATHGEGWTMDEKKASLKHTLQTASLQAAAAASLDGTSGALVHSPPRPRVRKETGSGSATILAGVDHISTAHSPFVSKAAVIADRARPTVHAGGSSTALSDSSSPRVTAPGSPSRPRAAAPLADAEPASQEASVPALPVAVRLVTDATEPSAILDASWLAPVLRSLQAVLNHSTNYKVRIAAAQALTMVPSRHSFRIPRLPDRSAAAPAQVPVMSDDTFPDVWNCVWENLVKHEDIAGVDEKYATLLRGVLRACMLNLLVLAEKLDYGRMKTSMDAQAPLILDWLVAEDSLVCAPTPDEADAAAVDTAPVHRSEPASESKDGTPALPTPVSGTERLGHVSVAPFGWTMSCEQAIDRNTVHAAIKNVTQLFESRVKSIPLDLLTRYRALADQHGEELRAPPALGAVAATAKKSASVARLRERMSGK